MTRLPPTLFALLVLVTSPGFAADTGPVVPGCENCPDFESPPFPHSGLWYDPERSGSGFSLDVQGGIVSAIYYGFDETGAPQWLLAAGRLQRDDSGEAWWRLETDLLRFENGACLDCDYQAPQHEPVGRIELSFPQRNLMVLRIDGGDERRMIPLVFGSSTQTLADAPDYPLVDFAGSGRLSIAPAVAPWVFIQRKASLESDVFGYAQPFYYTYWGTVRRNADDWYSISFYEYTQLPESLNVALLRCGVPENIEGNLPESARKGGDDPYCFVRVFLGSASFAYYYMPIANMGDSYFMAVADDGTILEGHRLLYR